MRTADILAALLNPHQRPAVLDCLQALALPLHADDPECMALDRAIRAIEDHEESMRAVAEMRSDDLENEPLRHLDRGEYDAGTQRVCGFLMGAV